mgnify:CR=1 FL=1
MKRENLGERRERKEEREREREREKLGESFFEHTTLYNTGIPKLLENFRAT